MVKRKKKVPTKKKRIYEFFRVRKKGRVKTIKKIGVEKTTIGTKNQIERQNIFLRNMFIGLGIIILILIGISLTSDYLSHFEHRGVEFKIIREKDLVFYNTALPLYLQGTHVADYNFYIRNDPRKLENISFEGGLSLAPGPLVIKSNDEFFCDGDGIIAMANFAKPFELLNIQTIRDENATCDPLGRYTLVTINSGNQTKVENQGYSGTACYDIYVKDCEILQATERFMVELFVQLNQNA